MNEWATANLQIIETLLLNEVTEHTDDELNDEQKRGQGDYSGNDGWLRFISELTQEVVHGPSSSCNRIMPVQELRSS